MAINGYLIFALDMLKLGLTCYMDTIVTLLQLPVWWWIFNNWFLERKPWFVAFAHFCGVNTFTMADFVLPIWCHCTQSWGEMYTISSPKLYEPTPTRLLRVKFLSGESLYSAYTLPPSDRRGLQTHNPFPSTFIGHLIHEIFESTSC